MRWSTPSWRRLDHSLYGLGNVGTIRDFANRFGFRHHRPVIWPINEPPAQVTRELAYAASPDRRPGERTWLLTRRHRNDGVLSSPGSKNLDLLRAGISRSPASPAAMALLTGRSSC